MWPLGELAGDLRQNGAPVEILAGKLLPHATPEAVVASALADYSATSF